MFGVLVLGVYEGLDGGYLCYFGGNVDLVGLVFFGFMFGFDCEYVFVYCGFDLFWCGVWYVEFWVNGFW